MKNILKSGAIFVFGAAIGSIGSYIYLKKNLTDQYINELNEFKKTYNGKPNLEDYIDDTEDVFEKIVDDNSYSSKNDKTQPVDYTKYIKEEQKGTDTMPGIQQDVYLPTYIAPEEYGEYMDYEQIELTYFSDGIVANENNIALSEEETLEALGDCFADHFGEYEPDSVYVRNDVKRCEYQVLKDERSFEEAMQAIYAFE